jgi:hypothetical protein
MTPWSALLPPDAYTRAVPRGGAGATYPPGYRGDPTKERAPPRHGRLSERSSLAMPEPICSDRSANSARPRPSPSGSTATSCAGSPNATPAPCRWWCGGCTTPSPPADVRARCTHGWPAAVEARSADPYWIDENMRPIPDHYHAHARRRIDWTRP